MFESMPCWLRSAYGVQHWVGRRLTVLAVLAKLVQQIVTTWPGEKADISAYKGLFAFSLPADLNVYLAGQHQLDILQRTAAIMRLTVHKPFSLELQKTYAVRPSH